MRFRRIISVFARCAVAVLCCAPSAKAQFGQVFDMAKVDGTNAKLFMGVLRSSNTGRPAVTGDLNGDGFPDLLIGAASPGLPGLDPDDFPGTVYVVFGGPTFDAFDIVGLETLTRESGFAIVGPQPTGSFGTEIASGFDWNDDCIEDYIIAATGHRVGPYDDAGQVFVLFGRTPLGGLGQVFRSRSLTESTAFASTALGSSRRSALR